MSDANNTKLIETKWFPHKKLIVTQLSGDIDEADVSNWAGTLESTLNSIPDNDSFKILVNLYGFKAADINAHKKFRVVIPETLAKYGWKTGYVNLFDEAKDMTITTTRRTTCVGAAHVHDDASKMEKYESMFSRSNERFFTDFTKAKQWIEDLEV